MADLKIKSQFTETYVAFGKEPVKLGKKSQKELRDLAIMAVDSDNQHLISLFEGELENVDVEALKKARADEEKEKLEKKAGQRNPSKMVNQPPAKGEAPKPANQNQTTQTGNQP